ncbi:MAG: penicillin-binding protein 1C [Paracoccaceae bacterium]
MIRRARTNQPHRWCLFLALGLFLSATARDLTNRWIDATAIPPLTLETSVEVLDRNGALLRAFTVADGRWRLAPGPVDPAFLSLLVNYEDRRFYRHHGVDPLALARAGLQAIWAGKIRSGGSTLTMQVARLLEESGTGKWQGKLRQIRLALALERRLSKSEILELYLHLAPYGGNIEGVRAASFAWLGKEPRRLTLAEAALLVALPQAPEARRPDRFAAEARAARDRVLTGLADAGLLSGAEVAAALQDPVPTARRAFPDTAALLAERLRREHPGVQRIATTIDGRLQRALENLASKAARRGGERLAIAMLVADHQTGDILASVGAAEWGNEARGGFIDMTQALRSPGSTLKPFVYGLAFDQGLAHPETLIEDRPVIFGTYQPQNFDKRFRGTLPVWQALIQSLNIPVISLTEALGPANFLAALRRAGARVEVPGGKAGLAVALGGLGISLQDLVQSYAALARLGDPVRLRLIQSDPTTLPHRLFSPQAAWQVADILAQLPPPPGAAPGRLAYKTGTSYGHRDALAIGFDGRHVAGIWIGRADGTPVPGAFGGDLAAPVLFELFGRLKARFDPLPAPPPATLMLTNAALPQPLRHFRNRAEGLASAKGAAGSPVVAFPPEGAALDATDGLVSVRVQDGTAPFVWLVNGAPVLMGEKRREAALPLAGKGYYRLSVIDAAGQSAAVNVTLN